jgi:hypothetical protein
LPSQLPNNVTSALDEAYARGVELGKRAGLACAANHVRTLPYSVTNAAIIEHLERLKHA